MDVEFTDEFYAFEGLCGSLVADFGCIVAASHLVLEFLLVEGILAVSVPVSHVSLGVY